MANNKKINLDVKAWINNIKNFFKNFPKLPRDEQIAWIAIFVGIVLIIIGMFL